MLIPALINGSTRKLVTTLELVALPFLPLHVSFEFEFQFEFILLFVLVVAADASSSGIEQMREAWESHRKSYTAQFFQVDPSVVTFLLYVQFFLLSLTMF